MKLSHNFRLIEVLPDVPPVVQLDLYLGTSELSGGGGENQKYCIAQVQI